MPKRYYWLKLQDGFFNSKRIKKLRKLAGGDTYTIIYLKMQLLAMKTDGILRWTGLEDDFATELALDLDEAPDNVEVTLRYLLTCGLAETDDNRAFFFPYAIENTGSEGSSAKRMRDSRAKQKMIASHCDGEKEIEKEKEKEIEIDKEIDILSAKASSVYTEEFEKFWEVYPRKMAKKDAFKAFKKVNVPLQTLIDAVNAQAESDAWQRDNGRYIPYPATWLNQGRWDDILEQKEVLPF